MVCVFYDLQVVTELGLDFTEEEMRDMIEEADPSGDGRVNYQGVYIHTRINQPDPN